MVFVKGALITALGLILLFFGVGLFLPSTAHVERSIVVDAPQATVFALTNGYARFNEWSPWAEMDADTEYTYEGPSCGVGAKMSWISDNKNVGSGSQEVVFSTPFDEVKVQLDFGEQGIADAFYHFIPVDGGVNVTWGFDTDFGFNLIGRWFGLFFDSMIGSDYEKGLANLKALAESLPDADWSELEVSLVEIDPIVIASTRGSCPHEMGQIGPALAKAYGKVASFLAKNRLDQAGMPLVINHEWKTDYVFEAGIPIDRAAEVAPSSSEVIISATPGGRTVKAVHVGSYADMGSTYQQLKAYAAVHGLELKEPAWEQYISDPGDTLEAELITHIYYPVN